jgi:hypothetical protein
VLSQWLAGMIRGKHLLTFLTSSNALWCGRFSTQMIKLSFHMIPAVVALPLWLAGLCGGSRAAEVLVEAERFTEQGGWVQDPQSMDVMGSSYARSTALRRAASPTITFRNFRTLFSSAAISKTG